MLRPERRLTVVDVPGRWQVRCARVAKRHPSASDDEDEASDGRSNDQLPHVNPPFLNAVETATCSISRKTRTRPLSRGKTAPTASPALAGSNAQPSSTTLKSSESRRS